MLPMHSIAQIAAEGIVSSLVLGMVVATIAWLLAECCLPGMPDCASPCGSAHWE